MTISPRSGSRRRPRAYRVRVREHDRMRARRMTAMHGALADDASTDIANPGICFAPRTTRTGRHRWARSCTHRQRRSAPRTAPDIGAADSAHVDGAGTVASGKDFSAFQPPQARCARRRFAAAQSPPMAIHAPRCVAWCCWRWSSRRPCSRPISWPPCCRITAASRSNSPSSRCSRSCSCGFPRDSGPRWRDSCCCCVDTIATRSSAQTRDDTPLDRQRAHRDRHADLQRKRRARLRRSARDLRFARAHGRARALRFLRAVATPTIRISASPSCEAWLDLCRAIGGFGRIFYRLASAPHQAQERQCRRFLPALGQQATATWSCSTPTAS